MTSADERPGDVRSEQEESPATESMPPPPADEPTDDAGLTADGSVLDDVPDTTTGKQNLVQNDELGPGPGV
jgi:hypothetical protein